MDFDKYFEQGKAEMLELLVQLSKPKIKELAKEIKKGTGARKSFQAKRLFDNPPFKKYGFNEAAISGIYSPFPHEYKERVTCGPAAAVTFFVADELGFKPMYFEVYGLTSSEAKRHGVLDHALITIDVGNKKRIIIDHLLSMYGSVDIDEEKKTITVDNNRDTDYRKKQFAGLNKYTRGTLLDRIMKNRTPESAIKILNSGEQIRDRFCFSGVCSDMWATFDTKNNCLETTVHETIPELKSRGVRQQIYFDNSGKIASKRMQVFSYTENNWTKYEGFSPLMDYPMDLLDQLFGSFDDIFVKKDKNLSRLKKHNRVFNVINYLRENGLSNFEIRECGFTDNLDIKTIKKSFAKIEDQMQKDYRELQESPDWSRQERLFLLRELYGHRLAEAKSGNIDHCGYLYSEKDRNHKLEERLSKTMESQAKTFVEWEKFVKKTCGLGNLGYHTAKYDDSRNISRQNERDLIDLGFFKQIDKKRYYYIMDHVSFAKEHLHRPIEELRDEVKTFGGDAYNQYKAQIWTCAIVAYQAKGCLNDKRYTPKLIDKVKWNYVVNMIKEKIEEIEDKHPDIANDCAKALGLAIYHSGPPDYLMDITKIVVSPNDYKL